MESTEDVTESVDQTANTTTITLATTSEELTEKKTSNDTKDTSIISDVTETGSVKHVTIVEEIDGEDNKDMKKNRHEDDEDDKEVDDMFVDKNLTIFGDNEESVLDENMISYIVSSDTATEEEEESLEIYDYFGDLGIKDQGVDKKAPIDRDNIINELQNLQDEKSMLRRKNNFLLRKLSEYYKKRKLEHVFQDSYTDLYDHLYEKYERKIEELHEERQKWLREKTLIDDEINNMQLTKTLHERYLDKILNNMLNREKEVGALLVDPNTGKKVPEKVYERLIQRQRLKSSEIAEIRLVYITNRDKVKDIESQLKALETIDGTLHLMDFEQLRMENTTYTDKIEERDEELMRLRERHSHANSVLAHTREKSNVIVEEIEDKKEESVRQGYNVSEIREYLNELKIKRDNNRALAEKLNLNSGLLTHPRLLLDMEESLKLEGELSIQIEELKATNKSHRTKLTAIRNAIEQTEHTLIKGNSGRRKQSQGDKSYYRKRPTIFVPKISDLVHNPKYQQSF